VRSVGFIEPLLRGGVDGRGAPFLGALGFDRLDKDRGRDGDKGRTGTAVDPLRGLFSGLYDAIGKDLEMMRQASEEDVL
jgi:hypothetical protein